MKMRSDQRFSLLVVMGDGARWPARKRVGESGDGQLLGSKS